MRSATLLLGNNQAVTATVLLHSVYLLAVECWKNLGAIRWMLPKAQYCPA